MNPHPRDEREIARRHLVPHFTGAKVWRDPGLPIIVRGETSRFKVISRHWAYHGTTLGALSVSGIPKFRDPYAPLLWNGVRHVANTLGASVTPGTPARDLACVRAVEDAILAEGPETVSMIIAEPVQNGRGALVPPPGYWQELRRIADTYGVLLVADEVITSFGRLGHYFGSERFDVVADMITFAKGVTSAYVPLGGVVARTPVVETIFDSPHTGTFMHGSTFGGHPVATAVALANMTAFRDEHVFENVRANEDYFKEQLEILLPRHRSLMEVRGCGYFYAVELMADRDTGTALSQTQLHGLLGGKLLEFIRSTHTLLRPDDRGATFMVISPPLIADRTVLDDLVDRVDQILSRVDDYVAHNA